MRVPKFDPPEVTEKPQATWVTQIRQYELITPLFGGGVNPTEVDPVTVVRATEIRGHLRFWWRATQGGKFGDDLARMKQAEDELFGRAAVEGRSGPSQVQVVITKWNVMGTDQPFEVVAGKSDGLRQKPKIQSRKDSKVPPYAAFPLQPEQKDAKIGMATKAVTIGVSFVFEIVFPKTHQIDIEAALWAWESFGGLGARTRRGFGALQLLSINNVPVPLPEASQLEPYFQKKLAQYVIEGIWPTDVPHLHRTISEQTKRYLKTTQASQNPIDCWKDLIEKLKSFRQKRNPRGEGRSKWPEPDEIRRLTDRKSPDHRTPLSEIEKFPRAVFGLPIIFHFKDKNSGDPNDTSLQGETHDRLGSPLILRPLKCANGKSVGLAVLLDTPLEPPGGLILQNAPGNPSVSSTLEPHEARTIVPLGNETDVLQAFLKTI